MAKIKVGVAGYGTIGQRLADGVALQEDMELVALPIWPPLWRSAPCVRTIWWAQTA